MSDNLEALWAAVAALQASGGVSGGTVPIASGGTGQTTQQAAITALTGTQTAGQYLRSDGASAALAAIAAADLPAGTTTAQGAVQFATGTPQPTAPAGATGSTNKPPHIDHVHAQNYLGAFGDGSDGALVFDGTSTVAGLVPASSVYTLTRDLFTTSLTINSGVTIVPAGFRFFTVPAGTWTNNGTVNGAGSNASGSTTGGGTGNGTINGGKQGANGATGNGAAGNNGGPGTGTAGNGGTGSTGSSGSGGSPATSSSSMFRAGPSGVLAGVVQYANANQLVGGGSGGGSGGGDGTNKGGAGGGGGAAVIIIAGKIVNNGTISASGGTGGTPSTGNCGGGAGGAGGLILGYSLSSWTAGTTSAAGGSPGSGTGTGTAGTAGTAGSVLNVVLA